MSDIFRVITLHSLRTLKFNISRKMKNGVALTGVIPIGAVIYAGRMDRADPKCHRAFREVQ